MTLSTAQAYVLLGRFGLFAREACDRRGAILGAGCYIWRGDPGFGA